MKGNYVDSIYGTSTNPIPWQPMGAIAVPRGGVAYNGGRLRQPLGHTAYHQVGEISEATGKLIGWAAVGAGAYHGYRRNQSIGWAIGWAVLAGFFPVITTAVAVAQGFGKRKGG